MKSLLFSFDNQKALNRFMNDIIKISNGKGVTLRMIEDNNKGLLEIMSQYQNDYLEEK